MFSKISQFMICVGLTVALPHGVFAKSKQIAKTVEVPAAESPSLNISEGISERIYQQTTSTISSQTRETLGMDSSVRFFFPSQFELKNQYFNVPYSSNTRGLVGFVVGPEIPLTGVSSGELSAFAHVGYAYAQGVYAVESDSGLEVHDAVELQWIPMQVGCELSTAAITAQRLSFGLLASTGMDWFTQSGKLDGMNQTFWVPRYELGTSLTLFSPAQKGAGGFDGVRLSGLAYRSFASEQINRGWAADLGARYAF